MPDMPGGCPHGAACFICHPGGGAGGATGAGVPLVREAPFPTLYTRADTLPVWTPYPYASSGWYATGGLVPEVATRQARQREAARQQEEYAQAVARQARDRAEARTKTEELLLRWLSPEQQHSYRVFQCFDLTGSDGRPWRILCQGQTGNVHLLDARGEWTHAYCAHPRGLPDPAAWLAQAMAVAHDAAGFVRVAHVYSTSSRTVEVLPAAEETVTVPEETVTVSGQPGIIAAVLRGIWPGTRPPA